MFIVQNSILVPLRVSSADRFTPINIDVLKNKYINKIMILSSDEDFTLYFPEIDDVLPQLQEYTNNNFFINLFDNYGKKIISELNLRQFIINLYSQSGYFNDFYEHLINRKIDTVKSYISFSDEHQVTILLPMLFFYQLKKLKPFSDEVNGSLTVDITPDNLHENIKLSKYVGHALDGKKIKKIAVNGGASDHIPTGYLTLFTHDKSVIEDFPTEFLRAKSPKDFWFDQLDIDFEKSYFKQRSFSNPTSPLQLTFIY